jgi:hypothetical protein
MRKIALLCFAAALLGVALVLPSAQAHNGCASAIPLVHGSDYGCVLNIETRMRACDEEVDGNRVRMWWKTLAGSQNQSPWAPSQGCTADVSLPGQAAFVRVCEEDASCSEYVAK